MYAFSTCWNSHRHSDGRVMLREIRELGFEYAELSHGIRVGLLPGIFEAVEAGEIKISSLHNFCPLPLGVQHAAPNLYKFTSLDPRERESAYRHTLKTLETAARLGAKVVVLHLGEIEMREYTRRLLEMTAKRLNTTPKYEKLCAEVLEQREERKERHLAVAGELLRRVIRDAEKLGVQLGIENREGLEEVPLESDFPAFFREFSSPAVGYWHDCGHAQIKENIGFIHHTLHLELLAARLVGMHVHDVGFPGADHLAPGMGGIDWGSLKPMIKPEHIKVFELGPWLPASEVKRGVAYLQSIWGPE